MASSPQNARDRGYGAPTDDEAEYDVVICGTDLIQSILSSALSRAGKKVLHCDGNEWYGGLDAVLSSGSTLNSFIEQLSSRMTSSLERKVELEINNTNCDGMSNDQQQYMKAMLLRLVPREEQGKLRLHSQSFVVTHDEMPIDAAIESLAIIDNDSTVKEKISCESMDETSSIQQLQPPSSQPLENGFCLDLTPTLLYASGDAVECLVKSGVSDYLEFKSLKGLYLLTEEEKNPSVKTGGLGRQSKNTANNHDTMSTTNNDQLMVYRVPCSKGDVFRSKLLSPMDKRRLMKFLQLISDYGMAATGVKTSLDDDMKSEDEELDSNIDPMTREGGGKGEDVIQSINERHLHRGRALSRPQNKATPSTSEMDALMRCVRDNTTFLDFLTQVAKLPTKLVTVVMYALALTPFGQSQYYSTVAGLDDLVRHMTSLGRFGDTAFLVPMYGSGELSQAFCRSGAVYGSTYMLRRSPLAVVLNVAANNVKGVLLSGEKHIGGGMYDLDTNDISDKEFKCKHIVVPSTMLLPVRRCQEKRTYRRISILQGKLMQENNGGVVDSEQRHAIVIPPGICGMENRSAIHGITLDDTAFVAPAGKNYTVLHLTTTSSQEGEILPDEVFVNALSHAVKYLTTSQCTNDSAPCIELHHISFSYATDVSSTIDETTKLADYPDGLHICRRDVQSLTCDSSFREAERIFHEICPDCDFLTLAKKVEDAIVYRNEDDGDDENAVLESACTMISSTIDNGETAS
jgi:RAB protein geranylgeranyltransferase component A